MKRQETKLAKRLIATMSEGMHECIQDHLGSDFYHDCARDVGEDDMKRLLAFDRDELVSFMVRKMLPDIRLELETEARGLLEWCEENVVK